MAKKSKIQDRNVFYSLLRPHVDFCSKHSYRRFEVHGQEHLPKEGALIYGINHSNTDDNYRTAGIVYTFTKKVLAEASLLTFQHI